MSRYCHQKLRACYFQVIKRLAGLELTASQYEAVAGSLIHLTYDIEDGT